MENLVRVVIFLSQNMNDKKTVMQRGEEGPVVQEWHIFKNSKILLFGDIIFLVFQLHVKF